MPQDRIRRIARISLTVSDPAAASRFFERALGFKELGRVRSSGTAFAESVGIPGAVAETIVMRLGEQELELTAYTPAGRSYPLERSADDPWFQHFAIVVSDMRAAYAMLSSERGWTPISTHGPQQLPQETGAIVAFKFRDPDGHPLELSWFSPSVAGAWGDVRSNTPFLGIDHSALAVADSAVTAGFYVDRLGFINAHSQVNSGTAQNRLDGLARATVHITTLSTAEPGPHIELLAYGTTRRKTQNAVNDLVSTRLVLEVARKSAIGITRDPDGHFLETRCAAQ